MTDRKKRLARGGYTGPGKPYIIGEFCGCRFPATIAPPVPLIKMNGKPDFNSLANLGPIQIVPQFRDD